METNRFEDVTDSAAARYKSLLALPKTILLVEEDDDLREVLSLCFESAGYVVIATKADSAERILRSGTPLDVLVLESPSYGKAGSNSVHVLTAMRPSVPVLVISGHPISPSLRGEMLVRNWNVLVKPFPFSALLEKLKTVPTLESGTASVK